MKDAARLLAYFAAIIIFGALIAPMLWWAAQWGAAQGIFPGLAQYDFERFFRRALMLGAVVFIWPLLRWLRIGSWRDLGLEPNHHRARDVAIGFFTAAIPLLCCGAVLLVLEVYSLRDAVRWLALGGVVLSAIAVPFLEEGFFRGLFLGILLRRNSRLSAIFVTSAIFSILHFLKAPERTSTSVHWGSGFVSIANSFTQFAQPMLLVAGFLTLFLIGWILADARVRTRSLWLPIGLHAGWIFANGAFNKIAQREMMALPWLGRNLLIGIVPLCLGLLTWALIRIWLRYAEPRAS